MYLTSMESQLLQKPMIANFGLFFYKKLGLNFIQAIKGSKQDIQKKLFMISLELQLSNFTSITPLLIKKEIGSISLEPHNLNIQWSLLQCLDQIQIRAIQALCKVMLTQS